jgi:predicted RNA binding protein YcfA (HicA-like mRNA interferase family)
MRIPRDVSGTELASKLEKYGYLITRQTGSHLRLTTTINGEHHITIPRHKELRLGTLSAILTDVADHLSKSRQSIIEELFGN